MQTRDSSFLETEKKPLAKTTWAGLKKGFNKKNLRVSEENKKLRAINRDLAEGDRETKTKLENW